MPPWAGLRDPRVGPLAFLSSFAFFVPLLRHTHLFLEPCLPHCCCEEPGSTSSHYTLMGCSNASAARLAASTTARRRRGNSQPFENLVHSNLLELRAALTKAAEENQTVEGNGLSMSTNEEYQSLNEELTTVNGGSRIASRNPSSRLHTSKGFRGCRLEAFVPLALYRCRVSTSTSNGPYKALTDA